MKLLQRKIAPLEAKATKRRNHHPLKRKTLKKSNRAQNENVSAPNLVKRRKGKLPQIIGVFGSTNMKIKLIKYLNLKKLLPPQYDRKFRYYLLLSLRNYMVLSILGLAYSKFMKASDKKVLEEAFVTACSEQQHLTVFQSALCDPFAKDVILNQGPTS